MKKPLNIICCIAGILVFESTTADEIKMYNSPPTAEEISRELFPEHIETVPKGTKMRSIKFGTKKGDRSKVGRAGIGMPIRFGFDSADILSESYPYLDQIGIMLRMEKLANVKLLIEGHTDASGSEDYNKILSKERAKAVKNYLISKHNVTLDRLMISGKGESRPLRSREPMDPLNRRVEFYKAD